MKFIKFIIRLFEKTSYRINNNKYCYNYLYVYRNSSQFLFFHVEIEILPFLMAQKKEKKNIELYKTN